MTNSETFKVAFPAEPFGKSGWFWVFEMKAAMK
jgi:hypothetical protein